MALISQLLLVSGQLSVVSVALAALPLTRAVRLALPTGSDLLLVRECPSSRGISRRNLEFELGGIRAGEGSGNPVGKLLLGEACLFAERVQPLPERCAFFLRWSAGLHGWSINRRIFS